MSDSPEGPAPPADDVLQRIAEMMQFTPQAAALGLTITRIEPGRVWGRAPYREDLIGDPDTGVIAGGVLTTFLDQICGVAAVSAMAEPSSVATIDLRIDYMRAAEPGLDIIAEAHCYKLTRHVAFVRAVAFERNIDDPIAHVVATFANNSSAGRKPGHNHRQSPGKASA